MCAENALGGCQQCWLPREHAERTDHVLQTEKGDRSSSAHQLLRFNSKGKQQLLPALHRVQAALVFAGAVTPGQGKAQVLNRTATFRKRRRAHSLPSTSPRMKTSPAFLT